MSTTASLSVLPHTGLQSEAAKDEWKGALPPVAVTTSRDDSSEDNNSEEEGEGEGEGEGNGEGEEGEEEEQQSVASGWNIIIATTVWLRVLGVLGDVSHLPHPIHREEALRHIQKTWILLEKVERGEGKGGKERGGEGRGGRVGEWKESNALCNKHLMLLCQELLSKHGWWTATPSQLLANVKQHLMRTHSAKGFI